MLVPRYWAAVRLQHRDGGRTLTVQRFGWSDRSAEEAEAHARQRVEEALARLAAGERVRRLEIRFPYPGEPGAPICEEVLARHGPDVVTRNSYGAPCLNTPDVLVADVDFDALPARALAAAVAGEDGRRAPRPTAALGPLAAALVTVLGLYSTRIGLAALVLVLLAWGLLRLARRPSSARRERDAQQLALAALRRFVVGHRDWRVHVYRTPAGLRLVVAHRPFDPEDPEARAFFEAVGADPRYARMCRAQRCFRARLGPKPWRIGLEPLRGRLRWPPRSEAAQRERRAWVAAYERRAAGFAACRHLEVLGAGREHPRAVAFLRLHDELSRARSGLPLA